VAFRRSEPMRWYLLLGILGPSAFIAAYHIGDWQAYLTPAWVMVAGLAAVGLGRGAKRAAWPLLIAWAGVGALLVTLSFRALYVEENENDRGLLVAAAGENAQLVTYRGPGYKSKQLNNYYRFGLRLEEERGLSFLTARQAFDEEYAYLEERPLYFLDKRVKRFFDQHRVDYVQRWQNENPLSNYFVTGARWPLDRLTVERSDPGRLVVKSSDTHVLAGEPDPIKIVVIDGATRRTRGLAMFSFADAWQEDPKRLKLLGFLDKIADGDWFCLVAQGSSVRVNPATLAEIGERLGFATGEVGQPAREAVLMGRKGAPEALVATADPIAPIVLELRSYR